MEQVIAFLEELAHHNFKEWFDAHKGEYLQAKNTIAEVAADLISRLRIIPEVTVNLLEEVLEFNRSGFCKCSGFGIKHHPKGV